MNRVFFSDHTHSPKPNLPPPSAYEPPPDAQRELGPPPLNFGRFGEFNQSQQRADGSTFVPRRNLDDVMCFKVGYCLLWHLAYFANYSQCGQYGHYANQCRNRNVPGNRGGIERGLGPLGGDFQQTA